MHMGSENIGMTGRGAGGGGPLPLRRSVVVTHANFGTFLVKILHSDWFQVIYTPERSTTVGLLGSRKYSKQPIANPSPNPRPICSTYMTLC